jgi:transcriptional regulator with XRE-family HTH domain
MPEVLNNASGRKLGKPAFLLSSELIRAARALLRWEQRDLAGASSVSLATIKRLESKPGLMAAHESTVTALQKALETAGVEFIDENGGGPGVRLRRRQLKKES